MFLLVQQHNSLKIGASGCALGFITAIIFHNARVLLGFAKLD